MSNPSFRSFFGAIFGIFLFTWIGLVVLPWIELGHLPPIQDEGGSDITPWDAPGLAHQGEKIYAADGCAYCHSQQVRPASSGADIIRGWGTARDQEDEKKEITRRTFPRDYIWQGETFLGNSREGADLSNVAFRYPDAVGLYKYLYDPYLKDPHCSMPKYCFLFVTQKISGQPSKDALQLTGDDAPPAGYEVVPTADAKSLVAYLLSLNKGYHLKPDEAGIPYVPPSPSPNS
jgi:cytochrome c oxidase cbb3-type subunit 2